MEGGPPSFRRPSTTAAVLAYHTTSAAPFAYGSLTLSGVAFQSTSAQVQPSRRRPCGTSPCSRSTPSTRRPQPYARTRFRLIPVRSPLLGEYFSLLGVLRCFSSPSSLLPAYRFSRRCRPITDGRLPHSDVHGSLRTRPLPVAFRSSSRPSSACNAKASPTYALSLTEFLSYALLTAAMSRAITHLQLLPLHTIPAEPDPESRSCLNGKARGTHD